MSSWSSPLGCQTLQLSLALRRVEVLANRLRFISVWNPEWLLCLQPSKITAIVPSSTQGVSVLCLYHWVHLWGGWQVDQTLLKWGVELMMKTCLQFRSFEDAELSRIEATLSQSSCKRFYVETNDCLSFEIVSLMRLLLLLLLRLCLFLLLYRICLISDHFLHLGDEEEP